MIHCGNPDTLRAFVCSLVPVFDVWVSLSKYRIIGFNWRDDFLLFPRAPRISSHLYDVWVLPEVQQIAFS